MAEQAPNRATMRALVHPKREHSMTAEADSGVISLATQVQYQPAWLTWVASTTTCLRALGIDCDQADVAGFSGYAFHLCVHEALCPSAPTMLDWAQLSRGAHALGRATVEFRAPDCEASGAARNEACAAACELVRRELLSQRPCVLWGTYAPEFGVAVGVEDGAYLVKSFKEVIGEAQPPIPYDRTEAPGGIYVLGFPAKAEYGQLQRDLEAILVALRSWSRPAYGLYRYGSDAYDLWIEALRARRADRFGCGYNAACYAEGRRYAQLFLERMSTRRPLAADLLRQAADAYREAARAMKQLREVFPFGHQETGPICDDARIEQAVGLLAQARDSEARAMSRLVDITRIRVSPTPPADESA
jgi:hypothetical protein